MSNQYYKRFKEGDTIQIYFKLSKARLRVSTITFIPNKLYTAIVGDIGNELIACTVIDEESNECYVVVSTAYTSAHLDELTNWIIKRGKK